MINRTFRRRISPVAAVMPMITALLALAFFWKKNVSTLAAGICLVALTVVLIERLLHTEYAFTGDRLTVSQGRFSRKVDISVREITRLTVVKRLFVTYVLIAYGAGRSLSVEPDNIDEFIKEVNKRQHA